MNQWVVRCLWICLGLCMLTACGKEGKEEESRLQDSSENSRTEESTEEEEQNSERESEESQFLTCKFVVENKQTLIEIFQKLVEAGYGESLEEWIQLEERVDITQYEWLSQIPNPQERYFAAEGYIMPGEYEIPLEAEPAQVLDILLRGWEERMPEELKEQGAQSGYSMDEILNMASIVEWESAYGTEAYIQPNVAAVVRNRLQLGMQLQMDTTIFYLKEMGKVSTKDTGPFKKFYDTYQCAALPSGPICNPGLSAVEAVLNAPDTKNLFFVWKVSTGEYFFAETWEGHVENLKKAGIN